MEHKVEFISLQSRHARIRTQLAESARRVIDSGVYVNGPEGKAFASELAEKLRLEKVVPVSNGLDAIRLIIKGYIELGRLRPGDEVILPANTYIASLLPITEFGLHPVLIKPDLSTYGLDWKEAERRVTEKTRALLSVHLYGTPSWDFDIASRLRESGILLLEDNAQAIGASIADNGGVHHFTGSLGDASAFSFYPTKNIGALGDAGAVATTDLKLADTVKALANYGSSTRYHNKYKGYNCRMDELQAAFLRIKLNTLDEETHRRRANATAYLTKISHPQVTLPEVVEDTTQVWHQFVIRTPRRDELKARLEEAGVATDIHYPLSLFDQECYAGQLADYGGCDDARMLASQILSLPIADLEESDILHISELINSF